MFGLGEDSFIILAAWLDSWKMSQRFCISSNCRFVSAVAFDGCAIFNELISLSKTGHKLSFGTFRVLSKYTIWYVYNPKTV